MHSCAGMHQFRYSGQESEGDSVMVAHNMPEAVGYRYASLAAAQYPDHPFCEYDCLA